MQNVAVPTMPPAGQRGRRSGAELNKLIPSDRAFHDWYRFVLSFPPHLVRDYAERFGLGPKSCVFDPFCGTGTTLVEARKIGIPSVGGEAHPFTHFAASTKLDWTVLPDELERTALDIAADAERLLAVDGIVDDPQPLLIREGATPSLRTLSEEMRKLLLADSISPLPLHKTLVLRDLIDARGGRFRAHLRLALAKELVTSIGNLHFGPEVGISPPKDDVPVISAWLARVRTFVADLRSFAEVPPVPATVHHADARLLPQLLSPGSIDAVITSPPYPNEKDYTRTTRLESVLLGFLTSKAELQSLKRTMLLRSNTRNVYKNDDDDHWVSSHAEIQRIAGAIEDRRIALGKTSGFERLYARVTRLYFGGMMRHLAELRPALKPGARLVYIVGDQASYLRIMIRTGQILASLAEELGYEVEGIDLFRTRLATATGEQLREEALILHWPGRTKRR